MILSSPLTRACLGPSLLPPIQNWIRSDLRQVVTWNGPGCGVLGNTLAQSQVQVALFNGMQDSGQRFQVVPEWPGKACREDAEQTLQDRAPTLLPPYLMFWALCSGHTWSSSAKIVQSWACRLPAGGPGHCCPDNPLGAVSASTTATWSRKCCMAGP